MSRNHEIDTTALRELALDLRWTWDHSTDELWTQLDPELWSLTHNPIASRQANSLVGSSTRTKVTADAPCTHCALPARGGSRIR